MKRRKWVLWGVLLLLLCGCGADVPEIMDAGPLALQSGEKAEWPDVKDYGAAGDAAYRHPLGERVGDYTFRVGYYSKLVTETYHVPYIGEGKCAWTYQVIGEQDAAPERGLRLSKVHPGRSSYEPKVGDTVVEYTAADRKASVPARDDSAAFEAAIKAGGGYLTLPKGDYVVSQLTAAKIRDIQGPGKIWLKEWTGGTTYYLEAGIYNMQSYRNFGWIDAERFHDSAWRDMHWITCLPEVRGWTSSGEFTGNLSPRMEFDFHKTRDSLNVWLTVQPAVSKEAFPDTVTVCIADMSANYTTKSSTRWQRASGKGIGGGLFQLTWDETNITVPGSAWKDRGQWVELTLKKEDLFRKNRDGETEAWALHCWSLEDRSIGKERVEYVCNTARVWVKEEGAAGRLMCDIGGDMRTAWEKRDVPEGYVLEACNSGAQLLTRTPRRFYAYTVPDNLYDRYTPFPS